MSKCTHKNFRPTGECESCDEAFSRLVPGRAGDYVGTNPATKDTNPKDRAATSRLDLSLWPDTATAYGAMALTEGDCKYGAFNWRVAGVRASVYVAALRRHLGKWYNGEEADPVTCVPHLASVLACAGILVDSQSAGKLTDDRPPRVDLGTLLVRAEEQVKHLQELFPTGPERYTEKGHGGK